MLKRVWIGFLHLIARGVIALRYRIVVRGLDELKLPKSGGAIFLPNHPAEIDPVIVTVVLWKKFQPRPMVVESFYYQKFLRYFLDLVQSIPVPDFNGVVNKWKQKKIEKAFALISERLKQKENFLIYPSGRLKQTGEEVLGGASFTQTLVQQNPDANVVLIRTTGLWGSRFSRALTGVSPDFGKVLWEGIKIVLKNLIFFTPKREVVLEIETASDDLIKQPTRLAFNKFLEQWYNAKGLEPLKLVSSYFWKESFPKVEPQEEEIDKGNWSIAPENEKEILGKIGQIARRSDIQRSQSLTRDLGLDSLDTAQLQTFLEHRYEIEDLSVDQLETVEDVLRVAAKKEAQKKKAAAQGPKKEWPAETRPPITPPSGRTLHEAFLKCCDKMGNLVACADATLGVVNYRRLKMMVLILSRKIEKMEGKHIGILMPSSTMAYAVILATLLAKKVPVMLNWTVGPRSLQHCKTVAELKVVISSRRFLDNVPGGDFNGIDELFVLLEDLRDKISFWDKCRGILGVFHSATTLLQDLAISDTEESTAVILFTSGTESLPKGVPLTHKNILSNLKAAMECFDVLPTDILYGILPPFHSFGFSVTGMMPLLIGLKVYYAPDPTHSRSMLHDIDDWKITLFISAPTFIKNVFHLAGPNNLKSLRTVVGGAEKVPDDLFAFVKNRGGEMLEGYGVTECSPVVTLTRPNKPRKGVGQPLPGIELGIVSPETHEALMTGQDGEIVIHGPNVFNGYIGSKRDPFINLDGKKWYLSGDMGHLEADGSLILTGRLKRFVKIGAEMISLGGLEEELLHMAEEKNWIKVKTDAPPLALAVLEKENEKPLIILFSIFDMNKDEINQMLREKGYSALVKIADVRKIEEIPLTGAGKTHYHALDEMLKK